jgi:hypothetical protein
MWKTYYLRGKEYETKENKIVIAKYLGNTRPIGFRAKKKYN